MEFMPALYYMEQKMKKRSRKHVIQEETSEERKRAGSFEASPSPQAKKAGDPKKGPGAPASSLDVKKGGSVMQIVDQKKGFPSPTSTSPDSKKCQS